MARATPTGTRTPVDRRLPSARPVGWRVARPTEYRGVLYRSAGEASYARGLDALLAAGKIRAWRPAPCYPLIINGHDCGRYTPDFLILHLDGRQELIEVKGWPARDFIFRFKVFRACYQEPTITVVDSAGRPYDPTQRRRRSPVGTPGRGRTGAASTHRKWRTR